MSNISHTLPRLSLRILTVVFLLTCWNVLVALFFNSEVEAQVRQRDAEAANLAEHLLKRAGIPRGVCSVLGCGDGELALEIARSNEFLVHVQEPQASAVAAVQKKANAVGLGVKQLVVDKGNFQSLPYADNIVDLIIAANVTERTLPEFSLAEILRALCPKGKAIIGCSKNPGQPKSSLNQQQLGQWAQGEIQKSSGVKVTVWEDEFGVWAEVIKPRLAGVDAWSHWEHGPDNNPVSNDAVIRAPYMTQWLGEPYYIAMPAITTAAGGRTFLATGHIAHHKREWPTVNRLIARNGYNGTILWERKLPEGYLVHRSAFVATQDVFYMIDGDRCLMLDAETGKERGEIRVPGAQGDWKWMAMKDGTLFILSGEKGPGAEITKRSRLHGHWSWGDLSRGYYQKPRIPWGFANTISAYDLNQKKPLWSCKEDEAVDSRSMVMGGGRIFFYCPGSHTGCIDAKSGELIWKNTDPEVLNSIEEPGRKLISTPGFRTCCLSTYTPKAILLQGQTRMNLVAISTEDGHLLWKKAKVTNNPNVIFVDGHVVAGVGERGNHLVIDPLTGEVIEDLKFAKRSCTRLTAAPDSFFCRGGVLHGEGTLRYDRAAKKPLVNGAFRPACNDGVVPANGLLYIGPWACDCNLTLMGAVSLCSAGDFRFEENAEPARLEIGDGDVSKVILLPTSPNDWPTYRADNSRSGGSKASVPTRATKRWEFQPQNPNTPTAPSAAGGLILLCGDDGRARAIDATSGKLRWLFTTAGPIKYPPTVWNSRAYVGTGDGCIYAIEAATGRMLWRFRAAPVERRIMVYGALCSTWPVNSGVLVADGIAYGGAGIVDYDGTYIYALDAVTGKIKWRNNSSGHLNKELRKGVSVQGCLTIVGDRLSMAGGNQVSPAYYDLNTGKCLARPFDHGMPKANRGEEVSVFRGGYEIFGGKLLYSAFGSVVSPAYFDVRKPRGQYRFSNGRIPPAWSDDTFALVNGRFGRIISCDAAKVGECIERGDTRTPEAKRKRPWFVMSQVLSRDAKRWAAGEGIPKGAETLSLAVAANAVIAVCQAQLAERPEPSWFVYALDSKDGEVLWKHELDSRPLPSGLLVDKDGQVIVVLQNGGVVCFGKA